jgi:trans-2,3-dihydro-3-hydroxyanthranilate isomerase
MSIVDTRCGSKDCLDRVLEPVKSAFGQVEIYQVDAFTDVHFGGNPAGVVPRAEGLPADLMQKIAREMNLSETAFVIDLRKADFEDKGGRRNQEPGLAQPGGSRGSICPDFEVRFFTPQSEVDLCGHATIGTFWLLAELGLITCTSPVLDEEIRVYQQTGAGVLPVDLLLGCEGTPSRVMMTQNLPEVAFQLDGPEIAELERILGAPGGAVTGFENARPQAISTGLLDLIVPVNSREALLSMRPDMASLSRFCQEKRIISVHCFSMDTMDSASTVHCRDFAPAVGIPEEAATGTASGATGAYLVLNRLVDIKEPVTRIICEQGHIMKRPSTIYVEIGVKSGDIVSVRVGGSAVTVMKGAMRVL